MKRYYNNKSYIEIPDDSPCPYCGRVMRSERKKDGTWTKDSATIDHIIPKARKGNFGRDNLILCCRKCNEKKSDMVWPLQTSIMVGLTFYHLNTPGYVHNVSISENVLKRKFNIAYQCSRRLINDCQFA